MARSRQRLPSLNALAAFEAAARLGGFTRAADELCVTQAAVSRQIKQLEDELGVTLFRREPRRVLLTPQGETLAAAVRSGFGTIGDGVARVRRAQEPDQLTVSVSLSFSHFWLLPNLPAFRERFPQIRLRVVTQDTPLDLRRDDVAVAVRYGRGPFLDGTVVDTFGPEIAYPMCSPDYLKQIGPDADMQDLERVTLIESDSHDDEAHWLSWPRWFAMAGMPPLRRQGYLTFNHYSDAVFAAVNGQGIVLGWHSMLARPLSDGRLVRFGTGSVLPAECHHVVVAADRAEVPAVVAFTEWLGARFREQSHPL